MTDASKDDTTEEPVESVTISGVTVDPDEVSKADLLAIMHRQDDRIADLEEENEDLKETVEEKDARLEMQSDLIHSLTDRLDDLEGEVENQASNVGGVYHRISELEETVEEGGTPSSPSEPQVEGEETTPQTTLEAIASYNQVQAFRHLSVNKERMWYLIKDITRHGDGTHAGYILDTRIVKDVIGGKEDKELHYQNASRILDYMAEEGQDTVTVKMHRGRKIAVIDHDAAERMETAHSRCEEGNGHPAPETVISA